MAERRTPRRAAVLFALGAVVSLLPLASGCANEASANLGPAQPSAQASCGGGGSECPTQRWMKANLQAHLRSKDFERLVESLERLAETEPPGFEGWAASARAGADAARRRDQAGVSQSCESCHRQHREAFRRTLRAESLL